MFAGIKTLEDIKVKDKYVLVRIDINSDIRKNKLVPSERLTAPLKTIKELKKKKARIILIAHQGRPGSKDFTSLKQHAQFLQKYIKLTFVSDVIGNSALKAITELKNGEVLLLENIRSIESEMNYKKGKQNKLLDTLSPIIDVYINDAFSAAHREHTSIVGFPTKVESAMGRVFEEELRAIQKIKVKDALLVLGGSKPEDNLMLAEAKPNPILASGLFAPFCLMAKGLVLGKQNAVMRESLNKLTKKTKKVMHKITLPVDLAIEKDGKRVDLTVDRFPTVHEIQDLGIQTIELYEEKIKKSKAVLFKGLAGLCNNKDFSLGTSRLLKATAACKGFTVISGGHTLTMLNKLKIPKSKFGYVSLSGGALIDYLANNTLPGIEALK